MNAPPLARPSDGSGTQDGMLITFPVVVCQPVSLSELHPQPGPLGPPVGVKGLLPVNLSRLEATAYKWLPQDGASASENVMSLTA